jgi:RNA polymerase sigma-70 factor (ECF subfamily)
VSRIAVRIALRQVARRRPVTWIDATDAGGADATGVARLSAGPAADPLGRALRGERESAVREAVARLADPYREVVALRFFGERSLEEIATLTGRPLGTVKTHLHRGLLRLRERLHAEVGS